MRDANTEGRDEVRANPFATLEECDRFAQFVDWLRRRGRSASTARSYRSDWQALALYYRRNHGAPFEAGALDAEVVEGWRAYGLRKGRSGSTVNRRLAFARTYSAWLAEAGVLERATVRQLRKGSRLKRAPTGPKVLPEADVHTLLQHIDQRACHRDQAIIYVLLDSGIRVSELVGLDVGDVDFSRGCLFITATRPREVPLPTRAARKLAWSLGERGLLELPESGEIILPASGGWPPSDRVTPPDVTLLPSLRSVPVSPMPFGVDGPPVEWPLFVGERGRLSANAVQRVVRKHTTFARVDASPQVLRHSFAFGYWARTRDLVSLAEILGHESVESTRMYAQLEPRGDDGGAPERVSA